MLWRPPADVYRTRNGWLFKFDLAGVRLEDVTVRLQGCALIVSGVRRDWTIEDIAGTYLMEISYNRFERRLELPCELENAPIQLESRDGILLVRLITER
jgi:HSP20 family protein